jgi:predicted ATP-dependent serine protease
MRGQVKSLTIAIRHTGEKREHTRQSEDQQTTHRSSGPRRDCGRRSPRISFNIIAGAPGSGKTTLAHQFVFANATPERPALYFTVLGESAIKMLRYQQQYTFFDPAKLPDSIRFINLSQVVLEKDLGAVLEEITKKLKRPTPPSWLWTPSAPWCGSRKATWTCNLSFNG